MASDKHEFGLVSEGLDRAEIGVGPDLIRTDPRLPAKVSHYRKPSIRRTLGDVLPVFVAHPQDALRKVKRVLKEKRADANDTLTAPEDMHAPLLAPAPPLSSGERLEHELEGRQKFPSVKEFIEHPVSALKTVARDQGGDEFAENVAKSEVSHGASVRLLRQEQKLHEATKEDRETELETLAQLKHARQDAFVRWSIDRHVRRVRRLHDTDSPCQRPRIGNSVKHWICYFQQLLQGELESHGGRSIEMASERAKPTQALLASSMERIVVVSASLQGCVMHLRNISHWTNPSRSAACMVLYFTFLFYSQITRTAILFILLSVVYRRWQPPGLTEMRIAVAHAENQDESANTLTELILQYGTRGWVDRVIDQAGPVLLESLEYTADFLERLQNFYEWRDPSRTLIMLCKLFGLWILITLTPTWLLVQMSLLSIGLMFFIFEPISRHFPRYGLLTSPMTWLMWKVPTHADWAIARLQAEALPYIPVDAEGPFLQDLATRKENASSVPNVQIVGNYDCTNGRLTLTTTSILFLPDAPATTGWRMRYQELDSMHKIEKPTHTSELNGLHFETMSGEFHSVFDLTLRDEIFSQILGYSGLHWRKIE